MTEAELQVFCFLVRYWIFGTLAENSRLAARVTSLGFPRLPSYYSTQLLASTKIVVLDTVPLPPFKMMGLGKFAAFEKLTPSGISYLDTYFVKKSCQRDESLHFHELVHILQWQILGPERYLATYMEGLRQQGYRPQDYRKSPLELMACGLQSRFEASGEVFDAEAEVGRQLKKL